ncbi:uncharacterized protein [Temnothorax nylanderi]|uniref:uncharacterized protein n=1 Tax=Temnothorax nylanderi TaxID=102681 RepID=UPI003A857213
MDEACELYLQSIGFGKYIPIFKVNAKLYLQIKKLLMKLKNKKKIPLLNKKKIPQLIDTKRFHFLANEIEKLFPGELKDTYYIPSYTPKGGKTVQARGKLIDKYNTIARSIRENGIRSIRPGKSNTIPPKQNLPATNFPLLESEKHLTIENCLEFLSTRLSPWDQIERYWKHTSHVRLNKLQLGTTLSSDDTLNSTAASQEEGGEKEEQPHALKVCNYFQIYKCLKQPLGYTLLEYDFSVLHPEASMRMVTHWNEFRKKVKIELEKIGERMYSGIKILYHIIIIAIIISVLDHKNTDAEILCGLPSLFSVVPVKVPKGNWRPNRAEIRQGFLLHLQTITDLEKITKSWKKDLVKKGLALQPFPFVVEDDLSSVTSNYVYIDGEIILLESPTRAVEVAFKFYHALHCEYPAQSERVWIVLQKTLFNLNLPEDSINRQAQQPDVKRLTECLRCA